MGFRLIYRGVLSNLVTHSKEPSLKDATNLRAFTGFDSAWTDNAAKPGAILTIFESKTGELACEAPRLATFADAVVDIKAISEHVPFHLVAIDQPTVVPNLNGCRPVERAVSSLICKLKGGVQPANRSKDIMFGDAAAIWRFLSDLPHEQLPFKAMEATQGRFLIEVFPAMALAAWIPVLMRRGRGAKYNPARRKTFLPEDWRLVTRHIAEHAKRIKLEALNVWATSQSELNRPTKECQDKLDAAICALIALDFGRHGLTHNVVLGDPISGYIVTPTSTDTLPVIDAAARRCQVPLNDPMAWS